MLFCSIKIGRDFILSRKNISETIEVVVAVVVGRTPSISVVLIIDVVVGDGGVVIWLVSDQLGTSGSEMVETVVFVANNFRYSS